MKIKIEISGVSFKENDSEEERFQLESDCFENFYEVARCILLSGYKIKAYKIFDGSD